MSETLSSPDQPLPRLQRLIGPAGSQRAVTFLILLNLSVLFGRPQELPGLGILGTIKFPLFILLLPIFAWIPKAGESWVYQTRVILVFLLFESARTFIGRFVIYDLVRNDGYSFHTLQELVSLFCSVTLPMVACLVNGDSIRKFFKVWMLIGFYLALYICTHSGKGPGGFLGDENDAGLALLVILPFPLALLTESKIARGLKLAYFAGTGLMLLGVVATVSRGAFVGLVCVMAYFFWRSQRKGLLIFAGLSLAAILYPLLPSEYISEMRSIKQTNAGTADIRKHYWKLARKVWLDDPRHIPFGVGFGNVSFHMADVETPEDLEIYPSAQGRAVHSLYFQLLPDLGVWGILIVTLLVKRSVFGNRRTQKRIDFELRKLASSGGSRPTASANIGSEGDSIRRYLFDELTYIRPFVMATNVSFVALFSAGAFISVLYYPYLWVLVTISALMERYCQRLFSFIPQSEPTLAK